MLRRSVRKRSMLGALLVLAASLSFPAATVAGNGYSYRTIWNYCSGNDVYFKVKEIAQGWTPTNSLTIDSWAQRQTCRRPWLADGLRLDTRATTTSRPTARSTG